MTDTRPEVEFDRGAYPNLCDAYRHENGAITYIVADIDSSDVNPRNDDGNIATLIQKNTRCIEIDEDEAGLSEARDKWNWTDDASFFTYMPKFHDTPVNRALWQVGREALIERYITIFRPDIKHYVDYWSAGDSYGWGYVTKAAWDEAMYRKPPEDATDAELLAWVDEEPSCTPEEVFKSEVDIYRQWADGEVYGAFHVSVGKPIVEYGEHGAYVDEYDTEEDSCWGFLGYDDHKDIASNFTSSPVTEVLY
jgi:hypothetical protein